MASEQDANHLLLREQVRGMLAEELLPRANPDTMWSGPGLGERCSICGLPILPSEVEYELLFRVSRGETTLRVHRHCHWAWEQERRAI